MGRGELQPGTILHFPGGRSYEILETIGGGGSALLYEAKALNSEQRLAIKELYPIDGYVRRDGAIVPAGGNGGELAEWKKTLEQREIRLSQRAGRRNHQVVFGLPPVWHRVDLELPDGRRFDGVENTYVRMESLREKGVLLNSAFAVSAAFVFGDHLAFTLAYDPGTLTGVIVGKLAAGVLSLVVAQFMYNRLYLKKS